MYQTAKDVLVLVNLAIAIWALLHLPPFEKWGEDFAEWLGTLPVSSQLHLFVIAGSTRAMASVSPFEGASAAAAGLPDDSLRRMSISLLIVAATSPIAAVYALYLRWNEHGVSADSLRLRRSMVFLAALHSGLFLLYFILNHYFGRWADWPELIVRVVLGIHLCRGFMAELSARKLIPGVAAFPSGAALALLGSACVCVCWAPLTWPTYLFALGPEACALSMFGAELLSRQAKRPWFGTLLQVAIPLSILDVALLRDHYDLIIAPHMVLTSLVWFGLGVLVLNAFGDPAAAGGELPQDTASRSDRHNGVRRRWQRELPVTLSARCVP